MITRTATLFSLAGVLVAGSAAAVVNSQVLQDSNDPTSDPSSIVLATSTTQPQTTSTITAVTVAPSTATTVAGAPASTLSVFSVGDAGVVSTDSAGGVLVLASAVPNPGWAVASSGTNGFGGVGVTFRSAEIEVVFNAVLVDGQVVTSVGSSFINAGTNTSIDDDRDDDSYDDDSYGDDSYGDDSYGDDSDDSDDDGFDDDDESDDDSDDDDSDDDHGGGDDD